jgi:ABC-2 type transport system ATP-binding protein
MELVCKEVSLYDKKKLVFENLSRKFPSGQITALYGSTGSGKTSLLLMLGGYMKPSEGQVLVGQLDTSTHSKQVRKLTGLTIIPDFNPLWSNLTVEENLKFQCRIHKVNTKKIPSLLTLFNLQQKANTRVEALTQPETFRTGLAMSMVHDPELILIDEPGHAMTSEEVISNWHFISELQDLGKTVVLSTHSLEVARRCDCYFELSNGKAVNPSELSTVGLSGTQAFCTK